MTLTYPLESILKKGFFGDYEGKNEEDIIKIREVKDLLIVQIAQYKNSSFSIEDINIDGIGLFNESSKISYNNETRILWSGPRNWFLISNKKELLENIKKLFNEEILVMT